MYEPPASLSPPTNQQATSWFLQIKSIVRRSVECICSSRVLQVESHRPQSPGKTVWLTSCTSCMRIIIMAKSARQGAQSRGDPISARMWVA